MRLLAAGLMIAMFGCGRGGPPAVDGFSPEEMEAAYESLCDSIDLAIKGRSADAANLFVDEAHEAAHAVARTLEKTNRPMASKVYEATERAEREIRTDEPTAVASRLTELATTMRTGLAELGFEVEPCLR